MERKIIDFEDEVDLKRFLDNLNFRYGKLGCADTYVVTFYDNKGGTVISSGLFTSPVVALRDLNVIVPQTKLPLRDIDVIIEFAFNRETGKSVTFGFNESTPLPRLSPFIYFDKKEKLGDTNENNTSCSE